MLVVFELAGVHKNLGHLKVAVFAPFVIDIQQNEAGVQISQAKGGAVYAVNVKGTFEEVKAKLEEGWTRSADTMLAAMVADSNLTQLEARLGRRLLEAVDGKLAGQDARMLELARTAVEELANEADGAKQAAVAEVLDEGRKAKGKR